MKRFAFRLQKLLEIERRSVDVARRRTAQALAALGAAEDAAEAARRDLEDGIRAFHDGLGRGGRPGELARAQQSLTRLEARRASADAAVSECRQVWEDARRALAEVRVRATALEHKRERELEGWRREVARDELTALDEFAAARHARRYDGGESS